MASCRQHDSTPPPSHWSPGHARGGLRRENYQNVGQYDISANGTLSYALGDNADVGRMMVVHRTSATPQAVPLLSAPESFQRFDLSPTVVDSRQ